MEILDDARRLASRLLFGKGGRKHRLHDQPGPLPGFLIIGAQKSGTTTLYAMLGTHPQLTRPTDKEVHYFSLHYERGEEWYRRHFKGDIAFEASPYYIFHPAVPERIRATVPNAKLIAILRDPVQRSVSHYFHSVLKGHETLPMLEALRAEETRTGDYSHQHHTYVARSRYLEQLERWAGFDLLVLSNRELREKPDETLARACRHIGVDPIPAPPLERNVGRKGDVPAEARQFLVERLAGEKEAVEQRYGIVL